MSLYQHIFELLPDSLLLINRGGIVVEANPRAEALFGYTREELIGRAIGSLIPQRFAAQYISTHQSGPLSVPPDMDLELLGKRCDGTEFPIEIGLSLLDTHGGTLVCCTVRDVSERRRAAAELAEKDEKLRSFYQMANIGIVMSDLDGRFLEFNKAFENLTGYRRDELELLDYWSLTPHRYARQELEMQRTLIAAGRYGPYEKVYIRKDGSSVPISLNAVLVRGGDGQAYTWSFIEDITEKRARDDLINLQANFDALTGLPNRRLFRDRLTQEIRKSNRSGNRLALLFIDLDHFEQLNDRLGHNKGDDLLVAASERISSCIRETDTLARLGGDEFAVIFSALTETASVEAIARKILDALQQPFALGNELGYISASIGIAIYPRDAHEQEDLLKRADQAMCQAKEQGRNRLVFYTPPPLRLVEDKPV